MRQYNKPVLEAVKLLVKEDIALTRKNVSSGANATSASGKPFTAYETSEKSITDLTVNSSNNQ